MAASDCSFCGQHGVPCVLRKGTAAICGTCANRFATRTDEQRNARAWFERELELARERALDRAAGLEPKHTMVMRRLKRELQRGRREPSDVAAEGDCSFCGARETYPILGIERFRGATDDIVVTGQPVRICSTCIERAVASARPS